MSNDVMSPEEIERMLSGMGQIDSGSDDSSSTDSAVGGDASTDSFLQSSGIISEPLNTLDFLSKDEIDVLGEVGNICMGTSATTMSTLLDRRVIITTPSISVHTLESLSMEYPAPLVVSEVSYIKGLHGDNLLILKEYDVALITNLLLGETEDIDPDNIELNEIHMSAMNEVMNQMVGSSATSLADIFGKTIDISTPTTKKLKIDDGAVSDFFARSSEPFVKTAFRMEIEGLLTSEIMQIIPIEMAHQMSKEVLGDTTPTSTPSEYPTPAAAPAPATPPVSQAPSMEQPAYQQPQEQYQQPMYQQQQPQYAQQPDPYQQQQMYQQQQQQMYQQPMYQQQQQPMYQQPAYQPPQQQQAYQNVQQPSFPSFSTGEPGSIASPENIEIILDVPMQVTVELGKTRQKIKNILEYNMGSVIVLDKVAGEAVDILVNGKRIGRGEVVVIDDNYGVRITEINAFSAEELL